MTVGQNTLALHSVVTQAFEEIVIVINVATENLRGACAAAEAAGDFAALDRSIRGIEDLACLTLGTLRTLREITDSYRRSTAPRAP